MKCVSVIILTYNEELHIARALQSVSSFAKEVFVIDSFSTDKTVEIARANGAVVMQNKFINHARQFQWALDNAPITAEWTMKLDADEIILPPLAEEICRKLPSMESEIAGVNLKAGYVFMGRRIKHGGRYPLILLRLWRSGQGYIENRWMDEHIIIRDKKRILTRFAEPFVDHNLKDLTFFIDKHNKYATREAVDILNQKYRLFHTDKRVPCSSFQASAKRKIKIHLYNAIPFPVSTFCYFIYRYIFRLGFLDGREGLIYHFLQGYWYRFLVGAKVQELDTAIKHLGSKEEKLKVLMSRTNLKLDEEQKFPEA